MVKILEMVANMKFEEKPNYDKFRQVLRQGLKDGGFPDDGALVFPSLNKGGSVRSPPKKRNIPPPPSSSLDEETENGNVKQRAKTSIKKSREPCSPKITNRYHFPMHSLYNERIIITIDPYRTTRRVNLSPDYSSDTSNQSGTIAVVVTKKNNSTEKKESKVPPARLDTSLSNPTPAMLAILARMRSKEETPPSAVPAKRKQARLDPNKGSNKRARKK